MHLSVIIVNYNVKYFLEQCLCSVARARTLLLAAGREMEVIVVDNCSSDGSIPYLQPRFPFVRFLDSSENLGFGKANNLAWRQAAGDYILFLNPDTILPEDCLLQCLDYLEQQPAAGALGIRMIDGSGHYLPESKRGFPSPWVSFCKMSGLTTLFPTSKIFAGYYMGHLDPRVSQEVAILAGAFMLLKKQLLEQTGGFDERFFMYAEDIDLSYRIRQAGFRNYYFAGSTIIHFKGESTRKDARYIKLFYEAMILFVRKHFRGVASWWYVRLLELAIRLKAAASKTKPVAPADPFVGAAVAVQGENNVALARFLETKGSRGVTAGNPADVIIYSEGPALSYRSIIAAVEKRGQQYPPFITGQGSSSLAGSHSKDNQGYSMPLAEV